MACVLPGVTNTREQQKSLRLHPRDSHSFVTPGQIFALVYEIAYINCFIKAYAWWAKVYNIYFMRPNLTLNYHLVALGIYLLYMQCLGKVCSHQRISHQLNYNKTYFHYFFKDFFYKWRHLQANEAALLFSSKWSPARKHLCLILSNFLPNLLNL